jgi:hypothetical protein
MQAAETETMNKWNSAPGAAQFYANRCFYMERGGQMLKWSGSEWLQVAQRIDLIFMADYELRPF